MEILIIANGEINDLEFLRNQVLRHSYIICADGAARYLMQLDMTPDILMGDLDSIDATDIEWMRNKGVRIETYPVRKDFTDTDLALEFAMELNPTYITLIGGMGSRWDHSIGNIMLLHKLLERGIKGSIINENNKVTITSDSLEVFIRDGEIISIIPITPLVKGVTLRGMEYPLNNHDIHMGQTIGISNVLKDERGFIKLKEGKLLVFQTDNKG